MIAPTHGELNFRRLYIEKTTFLHTKHVTGSGETMFRGRALAMTAVWFCEGTMILMCTIEEVGAKDEPIEKPETVIYHGFTLSSAIRIGVAAHDRLIAQTLTMIPEDAERGP